MIQLRNQNQRCLMREEMKKKNNKVKVIKSNNLINMETQVLLLVQQRQHQQPIEEKLSLSI